jgi:3-dehydroquinate synthetase
LTVPPGPTQTLRCAPPGWTPCTVELARGAAAQLEERLAEVTAGAPFVLADAGALAHHHGLAPPRWPSMVLPGDERTAKTFAALEAVLRELAGARVDRNGLLVAAGGGSICDLGGLAAALWLRGVAHALVPTTLLAMLDASVGGKTAIDLPEGKNLVGAFWPARRVLIDVDLLRTLPEAQYRSGLGEALKVAFGLDAELFHLLRAQDEAILRRDPAVLEAVVARALAAKIRVVEADPLEQGPRRLLNLGHTLGHALEAHSGYALPHGLAVARGLFFAIEVAERLRALPERDAAWLRTVLQRYGFQRSTLPPGAALLPFLSRDKKREGDALRFVVPTGIGASEIRAVPLGELVALLQA